MTIVAVSSQPLLLAFAETVIRNSHVGAQVCSNPAQTRPL
jgi:hypothetical protein